MDFLQSLPTQNTCIDIDMIADFTPIPNPNPNPNQPSSSSSLSHQFLVEFTLNPSLGDELDFPSEPVRRSPTRAFLPDTSSSSIWTVLDLTHLGLEPMFHAEVVQALRARVDGLVHGHGPQYPSVITLHVNIKRVKRTPVSDLCEPVWWVGTATGGGAVCFNAVTPPAPLDYDDYDYGSDDYVLKMLAIETLERVKADDEEILFMEDVGCAICIEELRVELDDEEKSDDKIPMKLPCKHVFHEGCIRRWFKKSYFCPLCRSSVFD